MSGKTKLAIHIVNASRAAKIAKASRLGIVVSAVLAFLMLAVSYYGTMVGNFTFSVDGLAREAGVSMYEYAELKDYKTRVVSGKVKDNQGMTGLCGTEYYNGSQGEEVCIPPDEEFLNAEGSLNAKSYIAHTFYVENTGDLKLDVSATINILSALRGAEEALRVRVIINDVATTYAKVQTSNGVAPGEVEPLTESFYSVDKVMYQEFIALNPGDTLKVTLILWYEGVDADHTNAIFDGGVKLDMKFSVIKVYENET
ncbi:MAG: hypothetical protein WC152_04200 [Candidatus Izemoplasmatales bacterium]